MGLRVGLSVGVLEGFEGSSEGVYVLHCIALHCIGCEGGGDTKKMVVLVSIGKGFR